jgi:hypothetical protein
MRSHTRAGSGIMRSRSSGARCAGSRQTGSVRHSEVRYVERDGKYLAYTVFGEGRTDLAIPSNRFPIDLIWEWPQLATFMEALGQLARVIAFDNRGFWCVRLARRSNRFRRGGLR